MSRNDSKDSLAYIPWYWRDWRASTARAVLIHDPAAVMAYRELLDAMWGQDGCSLPDDDASLAALAGLTPKVWARVKSKVLQFIPLGGDNRRTHPRALHEWEKAQGLRNAKRTNGIKGNAVRWGSQSDRKAIADGSQGDRAPIATGSPPSPSPSPSPTPPHHTTEAESILTGEAPARAVKAKPVVGPQDAAARRLATAIGSSLNPCRKQVAALVAAGWTLDRIDAAIVKHATPGLAPWDWTKAATGTKPAQPFGYGYAFGPPPPSAEGESYVPPILKGRA